MPREKQSEPLYMGKPIVNASAGQRLEEWVDERLDPKLIAFERDSISCGTLTDLQRAIRTMLQRWGHLRQACEKVANSVVSYNWSVIPYVYKGEREPRPEDAKYAKVVEDALFASVSKDETRWQWDFLDLVENLAYAPMRGQVVAEIDWKYDHASKVIYPAIFRPVPSRYYGWTTGSNEPDQLVLYPQSTDVQKWIPFPQDKFVVALGSAVGDHPIFAARLVNLLPWYIAAFIGLKEALNFVSRFGQPIRLAKSASKAGRDEAAQMMRKMGNSTWMVCPKNIELEIISAANTGAQEPHLNIIKAAEHQVDIIIGGQNLASGTNDTASNARSLGEVHNSVRKEVIESYARFVSRKLNQLVESIIRKNFGEVPSRLPSVVFSNPDGNMDQAKLDYVLQVAEKIPVSVQWVYDSLDIPQPGKDEELFKPARFDDMPYEGEGWHEQDDELSDNPDKEQVSDKEKREENKHHNGQQDTSSDIRSGGNGMPR